MISNTGINYVDDLSPKQNNVMKNNIQMRTSIFSTYESVTDSRRINSKSDQVKTFHTSSFPIQYKNNV